MNLLINSKQNLKVKHWKRLSLRHRPDADRLLWVEGIHLAQEILKSNWKIRQVIASPSAKKNLEIDLLLTQCATHSLPIEWVDETVFHYLSSVENGPCFAIIVEAPLHQLEQTKINLHQDVLLLDHVQDPGNLGTLLRTAVACGVSQVCLSQGCASAWNSKTLRAGMGAHLHLTIYEEIEHFDWVNQLSIQLPKQRFALALNASISLYQTDLTPPIAWFLGGEGAGLSSTYLQLTNQSIFIPQQKVESLNVAVAGSVALFEQQRQRLSSR
jgi:TrmH family RNA methyltransferase